MWMPADPREWLLPVLCLALAAGGFLGVWWLGARYPTSHQGASSFSALLTGVAILVAGYWYLVERRGNPHADLAQSVAVFPTGNGSAIIETSLNIKNLGSTLRKIRGLDVRLQQVTPSLPGFDLREVEAAGFRNWPDRFAGSTTPMFHGTELQWPTIRYFNGAVEDDIEPGETDTITSTFLINCSIRLVRLSAEVTKTSTPPLTWKARSFASTTEACGQRKGKR